MENNKRKPVILQIMENDKGGKIVLGTLFFVVMYVAFANLMLPTDSVFHVSTYTVTLLGKYSICFVSTSFRFSMGIFRDT